MLHAQPLQGLGDELVARAVEGGVHHLEGVRHRVHRRLVVHLLHHVGQELLVGLLPHDGDEAVRHRFAVVGHGHVEHVGLGHDLGHLVGVVGGELGAVGPVDLIAVILLGVVAGGDVDARDAAVLPDGKGQLGGGAQGFKQPHRDARRRHNAGGLLGEHVGVVPAVEADGHALFHRLRPLVQNDLGERLGGVADDVDVHAVQSHAHGAPQPGGAELQLGEEAGFDLLLVPGDGGQLRLFRLRQGGGVEPQLIVCFVVHWIRPPL